MRFPIVFLLTASALSAQYKSVNPKVREIVDAVDQKRIETILRKLETFETRHVLSASDKPGRGVVAAREWILREFKSYSPKLEVSFEVHSAATPQTDFAWKGGVPLL